MSKETLENLKTSQLDEMLQGELRKGRPNGELVRLILAVLKEREQNFKPEITPEVQAAWDKFNQHNQRRTERVTPTARNWVRFPQVAASVLSVVMILVLMFANPIEVHAETWWEKITRWKETVLEFFNSEEETEVHDEYTFQTDNPGLQEVYDAVVELGVTDPVVPMWLPEGYELEEKEVTKTEAVIEIYARFSNKGHEIIFLLNMYMEETWREFHKNETEAIKYENSGVLHYIMQNQKRNVAVWTRGKAECALSMDAPVYALYEIIDSIYLVRDRL